MEPQLQKTALFSPNCDPVPTESSVAELKEKRPDLYSNILLLRSEESKISFSRKLPEVDSNSISSVKLFFDYASGEYTSFTSSALKAIYKASGLSKPFSSKTEELFGYAFQRFRNSSFENEESGLALLKTYKDLGILDKARGCWGYQELYYSNHELAPYLKEAVQKGYTRLLQYVFSEMPATSYEDARIFDINVRGQVLHEGLRNGTEAVVLLVYHLLWDTDDMDISFGTESHGKLVIDTFIEGHGLLETFYLLENTSSSSWNDDTRNRKSDETEKLHSYFAHKVTKAKPQ